MPYSILTVHRHLGLFQVKVYLYISNLYIGCIETQRTVSNMFELTEVTIRNIIAPIFKTLKKDDAMVCLKTLTDSDKFRGHTFMDIYTEQYPNEKV